MSYEISINARQEYEENKKEFDIMPNGKYAMMMTSYESKTGKDSGKEYLQATLTVVEGQFKNRKVFKNFFLFSSEKASKIARAELSGIAVSVGIEELRNVDQLVNKVFYGIVGIEQSAGYPDKNKFVKAEPYKQAGVIGEPIQAKVATNQSEFSDDDII